MILASACLAGEKCRYNGEHRLNPIIEKLHKKGKVLCVCPEVLGGLSMPRLPCEIIGGNAQDVFEGKTKVVNLAQEDMTAQILSGCYKALELAKKDKIRLAVLKDKSVACAVKNIYDGTFQKKLIPGKGILTVLLKKEGIKVVDSTEFFIF